MAWFTRILLFSALSLTFFVGCNTRKQTQGSNLPRDPVATGGPKSEGTVDSGGGNTFNGKPLESYAIKVRELPAFKNKVEALLENQGLQSTRVKAVFDYILDKKTWYLIPGELKKLPSEKIASAVGTDQAALQDFKQVWLNQNIFDEMKEDDQATLLVHELLMGLRLLRFDSAQSECLIVYYGRHSEQFCKTSYSTDLRGKPSDLTDADYAQIRAATKKVVDDGKAFSADDWEDLLGSEGFSTDDTQFIQKSSRKEIQLSELGTMIEKSKLMKSWPTYGFDFAKFYADNADKFSEGGKLPDMTWNSDTRCDFDITISRDTFTVSHEGSTYSSPWTSAIGSLLRQDAIDRKYYHHVNSPTLKLNGVVKPGDDVLMVTLKFSNNILMAAELEKASCTNETCSEYGATASAYKVLCYMQQNIKLKSKK